MTDPRSRALSALARFQVTETSVGETLQRIAEITVEAVAAAALLGISMLGEDGRPTTAVYTDEDSPQMDEAQYREGKGPCLDAWREQRVVRVDDMAASTEEYPAFASACLAHGVLSVLSLPLLNGNTAIGAMNLYARVTDAFDEDDEALGRDLAGAAAAVLANVSAYWSAFERGQNLDQAMKSRAVIEQAKGMLMARSAGLNPEAAFDMLRSASQRENLKLRDIAERIVERRSPLDGTQGDGAEETIVTPARPD